MSKRFGLWTLYFVVADTIVLHHSQGLEQLYRYLLNGWIEIAISDSCARIDNTVISNSQSSLWPDIELSRDNSRVVSSFHADVDTLN